MVNSLNRIGLSPNCSTENRKLAIDLAQLIIVWELQRIEAAKAPRAAPVPPQPLAPPSSSLPGLTLNASTPTGAGAKRAADGPAGAASPTPGAPADAQPPPTKLQKTDAGQAAPQGVPTAAEAKPEPPSAPPSPPAHAAPPGPPGPPAAAPPPVSATPAAVPPAVSTTAPAQTPTTTPAATPAGSAIGPNAYAVLPSPSSAVVPAPSSAVVPAASPAATAVAAAAVAVAPLAPPSAADDFRPSAAIVEVLVNFLIRVALLTAEGKDGVELSERCVQLLGSGLSVWPDATIK